jgi:predicted protein tyrosine phosphatase
MNWFNADIYRTRFILKDMCEISIEVVSRAEAGDILCSSDLCTQITCLLSIGESHNELPKGYENVARRLRLVFADLIEGPDCPTEDHIRDIIGLADSLRNHTGKVLVHCEAGVSRSSATALIMYAYLFGAGREQEALERVLRQRPIARPNPLMISIADRLMGRGGRLVEVVQVYEERAYQ